MSQASRDFLMALKAAGPASALRQESQSVDGFRRRSVSGKLTLYHGGRRRLVMSAEDGRASIGVTGLAVMGRNLARNLARHGYPVAVHNRSPARTRALIDEHGTEGTFVAAE